MALMAEGRRRVRERFGVELEPEVQFLGDVDASALWDAMTQAAAAAQAPARLSPAPSRCAGRAHAARRAPRRRLLARRCPGAGRARPPGLPALAPRLPRSSSVEQRDGHAALTGTRTPSGSARRSWPPRAR